MKFNKREKNIISEKIKEVRGNKTMEEFSKLIGVSIGAINNYEKGRITPKEKILRRIIEISNNPEASIEEFIYGDPFEYILNFYKDVDTLKINEYDSNGFPIINSDQFVLQQLPEYIKRGYIRYGDNEAILKKTIEIHDDLKHDSTFIDLWNSYALEELQYDIEKSEQYRKNILPILDKNLKYINNLERYSGLLDALTATFTNDNLRTRYSVLPIRKFHPKLEEIFDEKDLVKLTDAEKARLLDDFTNDSAFLFEFWDEFQLVYKYKLEQYLYDYENENKKIIEELKSKNLNFEDENIIRQYKKEWWKS